MHPKGLKTGIIVHLLLIIAASMLLVDLVMTSAARRELLRSRLETGNSTISAVGPLLVGGLPDSAISSDQLSLILAEAFAEGIIVLNSTGETVLRSASGCEVGNELDRDVHLALASGGSVSSFAGISVGTFWPGRKTMLISRPVVRDNITVGAMGIALDLSGVYQAIQNSQRMFFIYFFINLLVFTLIGFYQIYRWLLKPLNRLLVTAEEFRDEEDFTFLPESRDGEFNRLSSTLNKMLARINRDRSRLKKTILDLEESNFKLKKSQQEVVRAEKMASVGRLSAGIAHEIGNPIGIVIGYLDLLKKDLVSEEQKKDFIVRAETEVNRINTIIRQMLDFARQPLSELHGEVSVHANIIEVVEICRVQPMMAGISIASDLRASEQLVIGNNDQLKQVFLNLLLNGADAINTGEIAENKGVITITTHNPVNDGYLGKGSIQIKLSDNGPGIDADNLDNIFDPFYTTKEPGKGTGLGLSICFTLIENMGGIIKVESSDEGTTMIIELPLAAGAKA